MKQARIVRAYAQWNKGKLPGPYIRIETHFLTDGGLGTVTGDDGRGIVERIDSLLN